MISSASYVSSTNAPYTIVRCWSSNPRAGWHRWRPEDLEVDGSPSRIVQRRCLCRGTWMNERYAESSPHLTLPPPPLLLVSNLPVATSHSILAAQLFAFPLHPRLASRPSVANDRSPATQAVGATRSAHSRCTRQRGVWDRVQRSAESGWWLGLSAEQTRHFHELAGSGCVLHYVCAHVAFLFRKDYSRSTTV